MSGTLVVDTPPVLCGFCLMAGQLLQMRVRDARAISFLRLEFWMVRALFSDAGRVRCAVTSGWFLVVREKY